MSYVIQNRPSGSYVTHWRRDDYFPFSAFDKLSAKRFVDKDEAEVLINQICLHNNFARREEFVVRKLKEDQNEPAYRR